MAGSDSAALEAQVASTGVALHGLGSEAAVGWPRDEDADIVVNAVVGAAGLRASIAALEAGKRLALANKESLVAGGEVCLAAAASGNGEIVPVDSEHAALAQCLFEQDIAEVERIVLTASGGPFRQRHDLSAVTPEDALAHPTWRWGGRSPIDSATLMNKGLEVIEAHYLFTFDYDRIDVIVHPQSVVHGMVELNDGSMMMQAAPADMRIPIQAALAWPERIAPAFSRLDPTEVGTLEFEPVDHERFPSLSFAYKAGEAGPHLPGRHERGERDRRAAFLEQRIAFQDIPRIVESSSTSTTPQAATELESVMEVDEWARGCGARVSSRERPSGPLERDRDRRDHLHRRDPDRGDGPRVRALLRGEGVRFQSDEVLRRLRPDAVVVPEGRDRVRGQGSSRSAAS